MAHRQSTSIECVCRHCGKKFLKPAWQVRKGSGVFCSHLCCTTHKKIDPIKRFWSHVDKDGPIPSHCQELGPCWVWTGATKGKMKYGCFGKDSVGTTTMTHRFSWEIHNGKIADSVCVLHRCDVGRCVNPAHLFLGTIADNNKDRATKNRSNAPRGERHFLAKLTAEKVLEIRETFDGTAACCYTLASKHNVSDGTIRAIIKRRSWAWLVASSRP